MSQFIRIHILLSLSSLRSLTKYRNFMLNKKENVHIKANSLKFITILNFISMLSIVYKFIRRRLTGNHIFRFPRVAA